MSIQPLKNDQTVMTMVNNAAQAASTAKTTKIIDQEKSAQPASKQSTSTVEKPNISKNGDAVSLLRLQTIQEETSARTIQAKAVSAAIAVEQKMGEIKDALGSIVKNYPPFLMGDEKRVQYLMGISSIREQIQKMTVPPEADKNESTLMWADMFKGVTPPVLEPYGPAEASDTEVSGALSTVAEMQAGLAERRSAIQKQVSLTSPFSAESAEPLSKSTGQALAATQLPLTKQLSELLKSL